MSEDVLESCFAAWLIFRKHCPKRNKIYNDCYAMEGDRCSTYYGLNFAEHANAFNWCPLWQKDSCCKSPE